MFRVLMTVVSGLFCVGAGVYLLGSQAAGPNSYIELIAHGMGAYFIGKGLYVWTSLAQQHDLLQLARATARAQEDALAPEAEAEITDDFSGLPPR